jgi:hypothetical protein
MPMGLLAGLLCIALHTSPADAGSSINTNACFTAATATYSEVAVTAAGVDAPDPVTPGGNVTLSGASVQATFPAALFVAAYRLGLLNVGANPVAANISATIVGSNTVQGTNTQNIPTSLVVTIVDPTPANRSSGDESALPLTINRTLAPSTWTQAGGCAIGFTQGALTVSATIGALAITLGPCNPSLGLTGCNGSGGNCTGFTPNPNPTPFETTTVSGCTPPTTTTTTTSTTTTTLFSSDLDHFKCYKVKDLRNPPFDQREGVTLDDQFENDVVDVKKPVMICVPASKNSSGINDPVTHICCYKIRGTKLDPAVGIGITDQFGSLELEAKVVKMLCQPCTKTLLP